MTRSLPAGGTVYANDKLLDAIAFSRGRFLVAGGAGPVLAIPSWPEAVGNHLFTAYVEDRGEPGIRARNRETPPGHEDRPGSHVDRSAKDRGLELAEVQLAAARAR